MDALLTPSQVADKLCVKVSTIYQWTHQQYIPHVKVGRLVRFDEGAIQMWLDKLSTKGRSTRKVNFKELGL